MTETAVVYMWVSTILIFMFAVAWKIDDLLNLFIKVLFLLLSFAGAFNLFQHYGFIVQVSS